MKYNILIILFINLFISCNNNNVKKDVDDQFEKSYKELKSENKVEFTEFLDSLTNVYSNFKYYVSFNAPNNWKTDMGISEHSIFRAYEYDSAISFSINVIEVKLGEQTTNIWELYNQNKKKMDSLITSVLAKQINTEIYDLKAEKSYISNNISLKRTFRFMRRELDYEFENTCIMHQVRANDFTFTFGLHVPTEFYDENPNYYQNLFLNISFLNNKEKLNKYFEK